MIRWFVVAVAFAITLGMPSAVSADEMKQRVSKDSVRDRVEIIDRDSRFSRRAPARVRYDAYRPYYPSRYRAYRPWDGRYAHYPRRHFYVSGVSGFYGAPVSYATVTYQTYVYYTPTYPSVVYGYPPFAYGVGYAPIYNRPCLC